MTTELDTDLTYKVISSHRYQCLKCHNYGQAFTSETDAISEAEYHQTICEPKDPFFQSEDGVSLSEDDIQKRQVKDMPGLGYLGWMFLGNCHVTFVNKDANERFTYQLVEGRKETDPEKVPATLVKILTGPVNTDNYEYIGNVWHNVVPNTEPRELEHKFWFYNKSSMTADAPSVIAFKVVLQALATGSMPEWLEIWHEGKCAVCGRLLTVPDSIELGIGPTCLKNMF